jgi:hypothetical protein
MEHSRPTHRKIPMKHTAQPEESSLGTQQNLTDRQKKKKKIAERPNSKIALLVGRRRSGSPGARELEG